MVIFSLYPDATVMNVTSTTTDLADNSFEGRSSKLNDGVPLLAKIGMKFIYAK